MHMATLLLGQCPLLFAMDTFSFLSRGSIYLTRQRTILTVRKDEEASGDRLCSAFLHP